LEVKLLNLFMYDIIRTCFESKFEYSDWILIFVKSQIMV